MRGPHRGLFQTRFPTPAPTPALKEEMGDIFGRLRRRLDASWRYRMTALRRVEADVRSRPSADITRPTARP